MPLWGRKLNSLLAENCFWERGELTLITGLCWTKLFSLAFTWEGGLMKRGIFFLFVAFSSAALAFTSAEEKLQRTYKDKGVAGKVWVVFLKKSIKVAFPVETCRQKIGFFCLWDALRECFNVGLILPLSEYGETFVEDAAYCQAQALFKKHGFCFTKDRAICSVKKAKEFQQQLCLSVFTWLRKQLSLYENASFKIVYENMLNGSLKKLVSGKALFVYAVEKVKGMRLKKNKKERRMGYYEKSKRGDNYYNDLYDADVEE